MSTVTAFHSLKPPMETKEIQPNSRLFQSKTLTMGHLSRYPSPPSSLKSTIRVNALLNDCDAAQKKGQLMNLAFGKNGITSLIELKELFSTKFSVLLDTSIDNSGQINEETVRQLVSLKDIVQDISITTEKLLEFILNSDTKDSDNHNNQHHIFKEDTMRITLPPLNLQLPDTLKQVSLHQNLSTLDYLPLNDSFAKSPTTIRRLPPLGLPSTTLPPFNSNGQSIAAERLKSKSFRMSAKEVRCGFKFKKNKEFKEKRVRKQKEYIKKPCPHCLSVEKTPEWRAGPYGSGQNICNACGLFYRKITTRFNLKKGNLLMRYRKAVCPSNRRVPDEIDVPQEFIDRLDNDPTLDDNYSLATNV